MGADELEELECQARVIQQNMRAWALRRNYKSMRAAASTLQTAWRERQRGRGATASSSAHAKTSDSGLQVCCATTVLVVQHPLRINKQLCAQSSTAQTLSRCH
jgi:hypothetical protein